jgi:glycosyltransferase involved in cell wall biosynthesis
VVAREARRFRPHVLSAQGPHEAFALLPIWPLLRPRPKLLVQVHGDWRVAARQYGSPMRRALAPLADRAAAAALRRADGIRVVGPFTARLVREATGREPLASYPTFSALDYFRGPERKPLPDTPSVAWIGMLERVKNIDGFALAWRKVMRHMPEARLRIVGDGRMRGIAEELVREFGESADLRSHVPQAELVDVLDASTLLVLPSRSEGTPRVVMEAFLRGRAVVGSRAGGIPDLIEPGHNGLLVDPESPDELAGALLRVLGDPQLARRLSRGALETSADFPWTPDGLAAELYNVVKQVMARPAVSQVRRPGDVEGS